MPYGSTYVTTFTGGVGPLNKHLAEWQALGWVTLSATRRVANLWDLTFRCGY